jgi:hypothetical protein
LVAAEVVSATLLSAHKGAAVAVDLKHKSQSEACMVRQALRQSSVVRECHKIQMAVGDNTASAPKDEREPLQNQLFDSSNSVGRDSPSCNTCYFMIQATVPADDTTHINALH